MTNEEWAIDAAMSERDAKITAISHDIDNPPGQDWPERLDGWTVDEAIECLDIDRHADVENELLMLAPQAYELRKQLSGVWPKLSLMARDQIRMAAAKEI
jgi:hypothetical protein